MCRSKSKRNPLLAGMRFRGLSTRLANPAVEVPAVLHLTTEQIILGQEATYWSEAIDAIDAGDLVVHLSRGIF